MKKLLLILVLIITTVVINAQRIRFSPDELPGAIKDNITREYPGYTLKQTVWDWSTTLIPGHVFLYDIVITNGTNDICLIYDKDGKFLKKGVVQIETLETTDGNMPKTPRPERQKR
jgi:hypothetical protein